MFCLNKITNYSLQQSVYYNNLTHSEFIFLKKKLQYNLLLLFLIKKSQEYSLSKILFTNNFYKKNTLNNWLVFFIKSDFFFIIIKGLLSKNLTFNFFSNFLLFSNFFNFNKKKFFQILFHFFFYESNIFLKNQKRFSKLQYWFFFKKFSNTFTLFFLKNLYKGFFFKKNFYIKINLHRYNLFKFFFFKRNLGLVKTILSNFIQPTFNHSRKNNFTLLLLMSFNQVYYYNIFLWKLNLIFNNFYKMYINTLIFKKFFFKKNLSLNKPRLYFFEGSFLKKKLKPFFLKKTYRRLANLNSIRFFLKVFKKLKFNYQNFFKFFSFFFFNCSFKFKINNFRKFIAKYQNPFYFNFFFRKYYNTNVGALVSFPYKTKKFIYKCWKKLNSVNIGKFFSIFILGFFENFSKSHVFLKIYSNIVFNKFISSYINLLHRRFMFMQSSLGRNFFFKEFIYALFYLFKYKDVIFFKNFIKRLMERLFFVKHKKFLYFLKLIINHLFPIFQKFYGAKGFYMDTRGKVSVAGDAKKRHYAIKVGAYSFSKINCKMEYSKDVVRTMTGVLGLTLIITY